MSKFVDFNLNHTIKFKVNEKGLKIWQEDFYRFSPKERFKFEDMYKKDEEDYYELQMWEFMRIFHGECHMGNNNLGFELNVKLEIKDKNEV